MKKSSNTQPLLNTNKEYKIIICEDERIVALDLKSNLRNMGYNVTAVVFNGTDLIRKAEENIPDLILTDISLPGDINGIDAAEVLYNKFKIPVVFLTGQNDTHTYSDAVKRVPCEYIVKPYDSIRLKEAIERCLI